jgi:hypothetical protein
MGEIAVWACGAGESGIGSVRGGMWGPGVSGSLVAVLFSLATAMVVVRV